MIQNDGDGRQMSREDHYNLWWGQRLCMRLPILFKCFFVGASVPTE